MSTRPLLNGDEFSNRQHRLSMPGGPNIVISQDPDTDSKMKGGRRGSVRD